MELNAELLNEILKYTLDKKDESMKGKFIPESSERFFMSMSGFECMRLRYFQITNPKPFETELRKILYRGDIYHDTIEKAFKKYYQEKFKNDLTNFIFTEWDMKFKIETKIDDFVLSGKPDIVMYCNKEIIPIELKSFNTTFGDKYLPNPEHITQLNMYLDGLNGEIGFLIYIGFNFDFIPFEIKKRSINLLHFESRGV